MAPARESRKKKEAGARDPRILRPALRAVPFGTATPGSAQLLTERQRLLLGNIAIQLRLPPRKVLYREDTDAQWLFFVSEGALKAFRLLPSGKRRIMSFLFEDDLCGLAERGLYVNSVQAITPVTLHRVRKDDLAELLRQDAALEFQFLCKMAHELRESQRQTILVGRRDAAGRLAMFLQLLERRKVQAGAADITIPMSRADVASYLGLSSEAVTRAAGSLEKSGIVEFSGVHTARVTDRQAFDRLVGSL